jgi:predicted glycosyltransferase
MDSFHLITLSGYEADVLSSTTREDDKLSRLLRILEISDFASNKETCSLIALISVSRLSTLSRIGETVPSPLLLVLSLSPITPRKVFRSSSTIFTTIGSNTSTSISTDYQLKLANIP